MKTLFLYVALALTLPLVAHSQAPAPAGTPEQPATAAPQDGRRLGPLGQAVRRPPPPTDPTPRLPDGSVDLSGLWIGGGTDSNLEAAGGLELGEIPVLPWVKDYMANLDPTTDPSSYCLPMGIPRMAPYPWRFVQDPSHGGAVRLYILNEGNIHSYRQIFMDGATHPADPTPTWFGHSIGRWEGDTLVIDSVGFNGRVWMDRRGFPQTEQMHIVERFTRINMGTLERVITLEDPGAYSEPFTVRFTARLSNPGDEILEYICNENNQYGRAGGFAPPPLIPEPAR